MPYLRGYGTTRFLSRETIPNGRALAVAVDITAMMDALKTERATIAGFDWGARTANIMAAGRALAGTPESHGVGERLSHRQPGSRRKAVLAAHLDDPRRYTSAKGEITRHCEFFPLSLQFGNIFLQQILQPHQSNTIHLPHDCRSRHPTGVDRSRSRKQVPP